MKKKKILNNLVRKQEHKVCCNHSCGITDDKVEEILQKIDSAQRAVAQSRRDNSLHFQLLTAHIKLSELARR